MSALFVTLLVVILAILGLVWVYLAARFVIVRYFKAKLAHQLALLKLGIHLEETTKGKE